MLPNELVERLNRYQAEIGLGSEVEAVRRLLDGALKSRDTYETLIERFKERLKIVNDIRDASKEVLIDHPLVVSLRFDEDRVSFSLTSSFTITINRKGKVDVEDEQGTYVAYPPVALPSPKVGGRMNDIIDDDIPF